MTALVIGLSAAALTITSFGAQAWKILRTRDTGSLSTPMWLLSTVAFAVWTVYGVLHRELPIIFPNLICLLLAGFILALKVLPRRRRDAIADALVPRKLAAAPRRSGSSSRVAARADRVRR